VPKERAVDALTDVWSRLDQLLSTLEAEEWSRPTALPGWDVKDNVAHIIGTEAMLLGELPAVEINRADHPHVRNDIGAFNEQWVESMRSESASNLLNRLRDVTSRRLRVLDTMEPDEWDAESFTPAGQDTYGRFIRIRAFDCWMHEQDIREAIGRPGGHGGPAAVLAIEEMATAMGFVVGKRAAAPAGSRVRFELSGPAARRIDIAVEDRARVVDDLDGPPTVTITMPAGLFARLAGGRANPSRHRDDITFGGDAELGERIVAHLAYTI
jgi:uncharacterized protein (TIGR03083 family)